MAAREPEVLRCSFCNKAEADVQKLIAGPSVFICNECVETCVDIIADETARSGPSRVDDWIPKAPVRTPADGAAGSATVTCRLCNLPLLWEDAFVVQNRAVLCPECVLEVEASLAREKEDR
jgi:hypothetical protein